MNSVSVLKGPSPFSIRGEGNGPHLSEGGRLRLTEWSLPPELLAARLAAAAPAAPLVAEVPVEVNTGTPASLRVRSVLTPQSVSGPAVLVPVRVQQRQQVDVELAENVGVVLLVLHEVPQDPGDGGG